MGKGGKITLSANGKKIAEGRLERTMPIQFSLGEGLDIGMRRRIGDRLHLQTPLRLHRQDREGNG